eukprot:gnl/MRDRNA2_/MRDRNA2_61662_c0_seq1.p1 gnl/MRDRNA2_/MRDRNA2_61662_c0~~gnl/MRDRNA2_/MRDRNA2_61662_c0_seq1.p1  ORF type:complete len:327 (+),score=85.10 gnl/MRDRNA2_/MRDRNA2_61662_c0_seq1:102-1082(+)
MSFFCRSKICGKRCGEADEEGEHFDAGQKGEGAVRPKGMEVMPVMTTGGSSKPDILGTVEIDRQDEDEERQKEKEKQDAEAAQRQLEAAERRKQRKKEEEQRKQELRAQAEAEQKKANETKEIKEALAQYAGRWILAKEVNAKGLSVGEEIAEISAEGILTWGPAHGPDHESPAVIPKPNGILTLMLHGEEHAGCLEGHNYDTFLQRLRWNDGEIWARVGPKLEDYNGSWSRAKEDSAGGLHELTDMGDLKNGVLTWHGRYGNDHPPVKLEPQPGGHLQSYFGPRNELHWVILEEDPKNPGTQRLRWSDDDLWFRDEEHKGKEHIE